MSDTMFYWAFGLHILVCAFVYVLLHRGIIRLPRAWILIVAAVPGFGLASLIGSQLSLGKPPSGAHSLPKEDNRQYRTIGKGDGDGTGFVVPLEEALLMSSVKERRAIMMDVLRGEPSRYIGQLKQACLNSDMEVTHYATTTIMELQRDLDLSLQHIDGAWQQMQSNADLLEEAVVQIERYLSSGLLDGFPLQRMRGRYDELLRLKARQQSNDMRTRLAIVYNSINRKDIAGAEEEIDDILKRWPTAEEAWLLALRLAVEQQDNRLLGERIEQMGQAPIHWSAEGRDAMQFWGASTQAGEPDNGSSYPVVLR